jgi:hypothetical protein
MDDSGFSLGVETISLIAKASKPSAIPIKIT